MGIKDTQKILAALRGEPAPTRPARKAPQDYTSRLREALTGEPVDELNGPLTGLAKLAAEALTATARQYMTELQVKDGASPLDARACADIDIRQAFEAAITAGADYTDALQEATRALQKRTDYYQGRTPLTSTPAFAEAHARAYTPSILRQIQEN